MTVGPKTSCVLSQNNPDLMDDFAALIYFNDHAYLRSCGKIKDAVDPRGILSPRPVWDLAGIRRGGPAGGVSAPGRESS